MSVQLIRYHTLDKCFRSKTKVYSIYELKEACEEALVDFNPDLKRETISEKQIKMDIQFMKREDSGFDIGEVLEVRPYNKLPDSKKNLVKDWHNQKDDSRGFDSKKPNRKVYYYYNDSNFSIGRKPLSSSDAARISEAILTLKRFKGLPQFSWMEEVSAKLQKFMDKKTVDQSAISFDTSPFSDGLVWIETLYQSVIRQTPLIFEYEPFGKPLEIHKISPYLVKEFNKRWFVLCQTDKSPFLVNLALDRIKHISEGSHPFVPYPLGGSPDNFFDDIVGVINDSEKEVHDIRIKVENDHLPYLITKPLHKSQVVTQSAKSPGWTEISLKVKPNYELYALLLSHGRKLYVSSPENVRKKMKELICDMVKHY